MATPLQAGVSRVDITPEPGGFLFGHSSNIVSEGVHIPLFARTLVLEDEEKVVALVAVDLVGVDWEVMEPLRAELGGDLEGLMVSASHTHYGPCTCGIFQAAHDSAYTESLVARLAEGVREAKAATAPVQVAAGRAALEEAVNRHIRMPDGSYCPVGKVALAERHADGPLDTEVGVIRFEHAGEPGSRALGVVYNWTAHPICVYYRTPLISPDYPGVASRQIEKETGAVALFTNGASGNVTVKKQVTGIERAHQVGTALAQEVFRSFIACEPLANADRIGFESVTLDLPVRREIAEKRGLHQRVRNTDVVETELSVLALGDVALVGIPGEPFVEMALEIKRRSPFEYTYLLECTNDNLIYIPTPRAYEEGGYEANKAMVAPQAFTILVEESVKALNRLKTATSSSEIP